MRRSLLCLAPALICLLLAACVTPLMHPLRAGNGFVAEAGTSLQFGHGREGSCDNFQGCVDGEGGAGGWNLLQLSGGYSWLFWEHVGVMVGLYFPGWENLKDGDWTGTLGMWSFFTLQGPYASIGVGPEVGVGGWALTAGTELQLWGDDAFWMPRLGAYGRVFWPYEYDHPDYDDIHDVRVRTWEIGGRLRFGPVYIQYTYYTQVEGIMYWLVYETAGYSQGMHIISIGGSVYADMFK
jgi:hypothetical protein